MSPPSAGTSTLTPGTPLDVLVGLLTDDDGRLVGILSVDNPVSGRRSDDAQRRLLERYAAPGRAGRADRLLEREDPCSRSHAESARRLIRSTSMSTHASPLRRAWHNHRPLVEGSARAVADPGAHRGRRAGPGYARSHDGEMVHLGDDVVRVALRDRAAAVEGATGPGRQRGESLEVADIVHRQLADLSCRPCSRSCRRRDRVPGSRAHPPCPGPAVVGGRDDVGSEIGHDLGAALRTARALEIERDLVTEPSSPTTTAASSSPRCPTSCAPRSR